MCTHLDIVEVEFAHLGVVLFDALDGLLGVGGVGRLGCHRLGSAGSRDAAPADLLRVQLLPEKGGVVLVLVHHRVEAQDRCRKGMESQSSAAVSNGARRGNCLVWAHFN